jgi:hypothetical protein
MPRLKPTLCFLAVLLGLAAKLALTAGAQISDAGDDPHEYVSQILHPANAGNAYGPGAGLVGRLFFNLGIPFHAAIEILFIAALLLTLRALFAWPWKSGLAAGLFLFLLFDPAPDELFSHFFSDQIWLVEVLAGLSLFVLAIENETRPRWPLLALAAFLLGLPTVTRSTIIPILAALAATALLGATLLLLKKADRPATRRLAALLALAFWTLFLGIACIYGATCWYNARVYGYSGISAVDSREYKTLYLRLQSVGPPNGVPYFAMDETRRRLIARAGPVSAWFAGDIENERALKNVGLQLYGKSDIPNGFFQFAAFRVALRATHGNLRNAFNLFRRIEDEIAAAGRDGRIEVRPVLPLPDTRVAIVLAVLPQAWINTVAQIVAEPPHNWRQQQTASGAFRDPDFTRALHRGPATETPLQEQIESLLVRLYTALYRPFLILLLGLIVAVFLLLVLLRWKRVPRFQLAFIAQQSFLLFFAATLFWYTLFDASGVNVASRYMMFHHLILPVLIAYYLRQIAHTPHTP